MGERCALKIRKPSALTKNYMPLILWREDVEELVSILKLRGASIEIVKGDYSFETLDEFENYAGPNSQTNVKIVSGQPYTSIELAPWQASLYVAGTHEQASGIFFELDKVLAGHQRRWPILYSLWFANVIVWGCYGVTLGARYVGAPWQVSEAATYVQVAATSLASLDRTRSLQTPLDSEDGAPSTRQKLFSTQQGSIGNCHRCCCVGGSLGRSWHEGGGEDHVKSRDESNRPRQRL
jgi:hypothetical protein